MAYVLDLTFYELGNVVVRLGGSADQAAAIVGALGVRVAQSRAGETPTIVAARIS